MRLIPLLLLPLALARQQAYQVYLHPAPAGAAAADARTHAPTLSPAQAEAVIAHHVGAGAPVSAEVSDEGAWAHLVGLWSGRTGQTPKVVIIEGVDAQDVLPTALAHPAFYMPHTQAASSVLDPYLAQARGLLAHILDSVPSLTKAFHDIFDFADETAAKLGHELSCLVALADGFAWPGAAVKYDAISIAGLRDVRKHSAEWETGRDAVRAGLEALMAPGSAPLLVILTPETNGNSHVKRAGAGSELLAARANSSAPAASTCYSSNATCAESTDCSGRGACARVSAECWACKCTTGYAGAACQKADYTVPFVLIIFTTVLLAVLVGGSVALLTSVGDTKLPSTLTLAVGVHLKRD
ncbi:hypothetical protein Q5752_005774 [Cryptotrichosporon argae]